MTTPSVKNRISLPKGYGIYLFLVITIYLLLSEQLLTPYHIMISTIFRNLLPILAVLYFFADSVYHPDHVKKLLSPFSLCGAVFVICGMAGYFIHRYQSFPVTAQAMFEHIRFWLCLFFFTRLASRFDLQRYAKRLFFHVGGVTLIITVLTYLDFKNKIWPRQIYRYGIGSIQLFFGHPSNLGAVCAFLIGMLCLINPYLKDSVPGYGGKDKVSKKNSGPVSGRDVFCTVLKGLNYLLTFLLLGVIVLTLRLRLFGFVAFFVILFIYMILFRQRLNLPVILAGIAGITAIGWKRFYGYYFSPYAYTMARGQFMLNGLSIANENFPFGSGFGTFGSRMAQTHYSPLYYKYNMMLITGISPDHPNYACDTFFPTIFAESGWIGFAAYMGMVLGIAILLFIGYRQCTRPISSKEKAGFFRRLPRECDTAAYAAFTGFCMLVFELLDAIGALSFSENYSVMIAIPLAFAIYLTNRKSPLPS